MPGLGLSVRAGAGRLDAAVTWAHVSELPDPGEFLSGGELILLTGAALPAAARAQRAYVARLAAAGIAALGFGTGLSWDEVPPELLGAAVAADLPLLEVPRSTPFLAITKAVSRAIARQELATKEQLVQAQRRLTAAAVGQGGIGALLAETVRTTGGWGLLLGRAGTVLAATPETAVAERAAVLPDLTRLRDAPGAASVATHDGAGEVWLQSLSTPDDVLGFLAVGGEPMSQTQRQIVNAAVPLFTLSLDRSQLLVQGARKLQTSVLRLLLSGGTELVRAVADDLWNGLPEEPVTVLSCHGSRFVVSAALDKLVQDRRVAGMQVLHAHLDGALVCLAAGGDPDRLVAALRGVEGLRIGVSEPAGYPELPRALAEADRAAGYGTGASWYRDLPRLGLLDLLDGPTASEFAGGVLRALDGEPGLLRSLRAWLGHHGQWDPAAAELGVHRHTLRNRVQKAERLLGRRLDSPDLRAELWLALQMRERNI